MLARRKAWHVFSRLYASAHRKHICAAATRERAPRMAPTQKPKPQKRTGMKQSLNFKQCLTRPTKTKRSGVVIARHSTHLSEPTRRFLRGLLVFMLALGSLIAPSARGQSNYTGAYYFNTFAGNAYGGDGSGSQAIFNCPYATAVDGAGNVYVADTSNYTVRKITPAGVVTTLAGFPGEYGSTDGTGSDARFNELLGIAVDSAGNVYVTDLS